RRRQTRSKRDWSSDVCSSDLKAPAARPGSAGSGAVFSAAKTINSSSLLALQKWDRSGPGGRRLPGRAPTEQFDAEGAAAALRQADRKSVVRERVEDERGGGRN